jgi:NAD(P)-dependent dehydrogenase (short-subunit alcohol dehydrogenase family)
MSASSGDPKGPQRALVTGAASGLGQAIALGFARRGVAVAIADIDSRGGEETRAACATLGVRAIFLQVDLLTADGPDEMVRSAIEELGGLNILVNNAGYGTGEAFLEMTAKTWDRTLGLNLRAMALSCAAAGRHMAAQKSGHIINITSPASRMALPTYTAYSASKAGVDALTRAGAIALAKHGVFVNSVAPGMMDTAMQRTTEVLFAKLDGRNDVEQYLAERTARVPLGRRTSCDEVAEGVIWLALDAPPYVTAERLNLSGGLDKD